MSSFKPPCPCCQYPGAPEKYGDALNNRPSPGFITWPSSSVDFGWSATVDFSGGYPTTPVNWSQLAGEQLGDGSTRNSLTAWEHRQKTAWQYPQFSERRVACEQYGCGNVGGSPGRAVHDMPGSADEQRGHGAASSPAASKERADALWFSYESVNRIEDAAAEQRRARRLQEIESAESARPQQESVESVVPNTKKQRVDSNACLSGNQLTDADLEAMIE